jgi:hypothetical protein
MCQLLGVIFLDKNIINLKQLTARRAFLDVAFVLRQRLAALDHEQHDLARAACSDRILHFAVTDAEKNAPASLLQDVRVLMLRTCQPDKAPDCLFHGWEGEPGVRYLCV